MVLVSITCPGMLKELTIWVLVLSECVRPVTYASGEWTAMYLAPITSTTSAITSGFGGNTAAILTISRKELHGAVEITTPRMLFISEGRKFLKDLRITAKPKIGQNKQ